MSFSELVKSQGQFNFRLDVNNVASSPPKSTAKSPSKSPGLNKSGEYYQDEERDDIYFEPVVTLPENVKLETGEEGEEIKFSHRAKLYRFDQEGSQWKERGIGDIKVLYNPETKKHRIVMRREQVSPFGVHLVSFNDRTVYVLGVIQNCQVCISFPLLLEA